MKKIIVGIIIGLTLLGCGKKTLEEKIATSSSHLISESVQQEHKIKSVEVSDGIIVINKKFELYFDSKKNIGDMLVMNLKFLMGDFEKISKIEEMKSVEKIKIIYYFTFSKTNTSRNILEFTVPKENFEKINYGLNINKIIGLIENIKADTDIKVYLNHMKNNQ